MYISTTDNANNYYCINNNENQMTLMTTSNAPNTGTPCTLSAPASITTYVVDKYGGTHNVKVAENSTKPGNVNGGFFSQLYSYLIDHLSHMNRGGDTAGGNTTTTRIANQTHGNNNDNTDSTNNTNFFSRFCSNNNNNNNRVHHS